MRIVYRYVGRGEYHNQIPARDLTEGDLAALTDEQRRVVEKSKLYRRQPEIKPAAKEGDD